MITVYPGFFILIVTSNYPIHDCFLNSEDVLALKRRFHEIEFRFPVNRPSHNEITQDEDVEMHDSRGELIEQMITVDYSILDPRQ